MQTSITPSGGGEWGELPYKTDGDVRRLAQGSIRFRPSDSFTIECFYEAIKHLVTPEKFYISIVLNFFGD